MTDAVLVINAGSTSLKFAVYGADSSDALPVLCRGEIEEMQDGARFKVLDAASKALGEHGWGKGQSIDHKTALHFIVTWLEANIPGLKMVAAGHRIVLSGDRFEGPVLIDATVLDYLDGLSAMEPSHQKFNVSGARAIAELFPHLHQVACFDNTFHRTMPEVAQTYALPKDVRDAGVRHWGYHGISFDYIARQMVKTAPSARRVIMAHLGGGASLCAMLDGKSIETTLGFAGVSGLLMATCSACPTSAATCECCKRARIRRRSRRSSISSTRWRHTSAHTPPCSTASTPWCSQPASANTLPRCAPHYAANWRGLA